MSVENAGEQRVTAKRLEIRPEEHAALTREELYSEIWGGEPRSDDRSVDVYVSRLRSKLGEALPGLDLIHTHNGVGYRFSPDG